jgi:hypothetical protein
MTNEEKAIEIITIIRLLKIKIEEMGGNLDDAKEMITQAWQIPLNNNDLS